MFSVKNNHLSNIESFVVNIFNDCDSGTKDHLYDLWWAENDLKMFRTEFENVPADLTAEDLMRIWDDLVLATFEIVVGANGGDVPRCLIMTDTQIATVIKNADSWEDVKDLIMYLVDEDIFDFVEEDGHWADGWDCEVIAWCDEVLSET